MACNSFTAHLLELTESNLIHIVTTVALARSHPPRENEAWAIGDLTMRNLNWVLTLSGLLVAVLFFTLLWGMWFVPRSLSYGVAARFDALPKNDNEFAD